MRGSSEHCSNARAACVPLWSVRGQDTWLTRLPDSCRRAALRRKPLNALALSSSARPVRCAAEGLPGRAGSCPFLVRSGDITWAIPMLAVFSGERLVHSRGRTRTGGGPAAVRLFHCAAELRRLRGVVLPHGLVRAMAIRRMPWIRLRDGGTGSRLLTGGLGGGRRALRRSRCGHVEQEQCIVVGASGFGGVDADALAGGTFHLQ